MFLIDSVKLWMWLNVLLPLSLNNSFQCYYSLYIAVLVDTQCSEPRKQFLHFSKYFRLEYFTVVLKENATSRELKQLSLFNYKKLNVTKKKKRVRNILWISAFKTTFKRIVFSKLLIVLPVIRIIFFIPMYLGGAHKNTVSVNKQVAELLSKPLKRAANTIIPNSPSLKDRTALTVSLMANAFVFAKENTDYF